MIDQIKTYFERFGKLNSVEIQQDENTHAEYGSVEFETVGAAAAVLSNEMHRIDGYNVQVKAAKPWHQPEHILNALNNDCLRAILLKLNLLDLTNAANVCVQFNEQAKLVFSTKYKKLNLSKCSRKETIKSLHTFGSLAQSVDVKSGVIFHSKLYEIKVLYMIAWHCTPALKELKFYDFRFDAELLNNMKLDSALTKLEKLSLNGCHLVRSILDLLSHCSELKVLCVESCCHNSSDKYIPKFDKLEELRLIYTQGAYGRILNGIDDYFINGIIAMNSTITKLSLFGYLSHGTKPTETIRTIVQSLPNLLELELQMEMPIENGDFTESIHHLGQLSFLKVLKLHLNWESATPLIAVLTANASSIEHIKLSNGKINAETVDAISQMKPLKMLELCNISGLIDEHMIKLAKGLGSQLEKLQLRSSTAKSLTTIGLKKMLPFATKLSLLTLESWKMIIDADDYKVMLQTLQKRPEKIMLSFELNGGQVDVPKTILIENRDILFISLKMDPSIRIFTDDFFHPPTDESESESE